MGWCFTQGGGLPPALPPSQCYGAASRYGEASGGLALGYYDAAPPGLRRGEPVGGADGGSPGSSVVLRIWLRRWLSPPPLTLPFFDHLMLNPPGPANSRRWMGCGEVGIVRVLARSAFSRRFCPTA